MVARRQRRRRDNALPETLDGFPGVDMSCSEDPAVFWGPNWKQELEQALTEAESGKGRVFDSLDDFFADLDKDA